MRSRKISNINSGSILLEISVALALSSIMIASISSLIMFRKTMLFNVTEKRIALMSAKDTLENALKEHATDEWSVQDVSIKEGIRDLKLHVSESNACFQNITSHASWELFDMVRDVEFSVSLANKKHSEAIDKDCGGHNQFLFASSTSFVSTTITELDFQSIDVIEGSVFSSSTNDIDATHDRIFLATNNTHQFIIADTQSQKMQHAIALPGVAGSYPYATSIYYYDKKVYIGTHRTAGNEFHIFDINSITPVWLGSVELNHNINAIAIRWPYAFLATSGNNKDLIILDISDPSAIKKLVSFDIPGSEDSIAAHLTGTKLYVGRRKGTLGLPNFYIIDVRNPSDPKIISSLRYSGDITTITVAHSYAFLGIADKDPQIEIVDVRDTTNIQPLLSIPVASKPKDIDIENDTIYVSTETEIFSFTTK